MRQSWTAVLVLVLSLGLGSVRAFADDADVDHYNEGQRLFAEKNVSGALEEFLKADGLVPDEPLIYSWIAACLNELGRYEEAKTRIERAFGLLQDAQRQAAEKGQPVPPIDLGYYTLLAGIQLNLRQYKQAAETINSYPVPNDGSEAATKAKQAIDGARQGLQAKLISLGIDFLRSGDVASARAVLAQADELHPGSVPVLEAIVRDALTQADRAPGETDDDKAKKAQLYDKAVEVARFWLELKGADAADAQRLLAKALVGTKKKEGYEEGIRILTALWNGPGPKDSSIQLDLAVAHAGLEQWDAMASAASQLIESAPDDPLGQGYCMRSYAQYKLGKCQEAVNDAPRCKNADGTPRTLKYVETCQQWLSKIQTDKSVAKEASLKRRCTYVAERVHWASSPLGEVPIEDLVKVIDEFKSSEAECAPFLDDSAGSTLCGVGVKPASYPLNLSTQTKEELEALRAHIKKFLLVCKPSLTAAQTGGVEGGLAKVEHALERPH
jgi:tetratricopeptide (TPR) repeat protein